MAKKKKDEVTVRSSAAEYLTYVAASAITSIVWAKYFAPDELQSKIELNEYVLRWFDGMKNPVPAWYLKESEAAK
jgi:aminoglycoside phosphotransferase (APT) family kinase protein